MFGFGSSKPKPTAKELARATNKDMRAGGRQMDREIRELDRQKKKLEDDIRKAAKAGNIKSAKILAKQLVSLKNSRTKLLGMKGTLGAVGTRATVAASTVAVAEAMGTATKGMKATNAAMEKAGIHSTLAEFARQTEIMGMSEEMMDDALCDAFDDESEEEDELVSQVLGEIGIDLSGRMASVPTTGVAAPAAAARTDEDPEVARILREALG